MNTINSSDSNNSFSIVFEQDDSFNVVFESEDSFGVNFGEIQEVGQSDLYKGDYEVIPKTEQQVLNTKEKFMSKDVTVHSIPYFEVSNTAGGDTVYIGSEIEGG